MKNFEINKVYLGDCLQIMKEIPDNFIDMVLCDLPYGVTSAKWDTQIDLNRLWKQYKRICKQNTPIVLFAVQPFTATLVLSNVKKFRHQLIWQKEQGTGQLNAKIAPLRNHEQILIFSQKKANYYPKFTVSKKSYSKTKTKSKNTNQQINKNKHLYNGGNPLQGYDKENVKTRYPLTVMKFNRDLKERYHPTQKPIKLLEHLIELYSRENDIVLDNTAGSSSTAIAAINAKRNWIMIEKQKQYYDASIERINKSLKKRLK